MIITLTGATFSNNINSSMGARYSITYVCKANEDGSTLTPYYNGKTSVGENETVTFNSSNTPRVNGYSFLSATPAKIENPTGPVTVEVKYEKVESDAPIAPPSTSYTFTINPNPTSATVTLSATGYSTVSGTGSKSITVANGTKVNWSVSAEGYTTRTGAWTANGSDETKNVVLNSGNIAEYAIYDSFDRDNTDDGIGSTDTGETWQVIVGPDDTGKTLLKIYDGQVKGNTTGKYPSAVVAATELDRYVEIEIAVNKCDGQILVYDKYEDSTNYIAARRGKDGIITLLKKINGVNTEVAKTTETYTDDNLVLAIQCIGNDHAVFANGTQILTGIISEFASATRVGFSINEVNDMCDNFKVKYL